MADFSDADARSLAQKLTQFKETLTQGEQAALTEVIQRAMPDVAGYAESPLNPFFTTIVIARPTGGGEEGRRQ